jgi:hypothetical protein
VFEENMILSKNSDDDVKNYYTLFKPVCQALFKPTQFILPARFINKPPVHNLISSLIEKT